MISQRSLWASIAAAWMLIAVSFTFNYFYYARHYVEIFSAPPTFLQMLVWEIPYWNYKYMPHNYGINIVCADGHAERTKGSPKEYDWWAFHSRDGWEPD